MLFNKINILLFLFPACVFLSAADNAQLKVHKELEAAFEANGQWCFFKELESKYNRLTYVDKNQYKVCKEGDLFQKIMYKKQYYARDLDKNIYKPHWQMKKDFGPHLVPADKYIESLNNKINLLGETVSKTKQKLSSEKNELKSEQNKYDRWLGRKKYKAGYGNFSKEVKTKLKYYKKRVEQKESEIEKLTGNLEKSENSLKELRNSKTQAETLYKKYAAGKNAASAKQNNTDNDE